MKNIVSESEMMKADVCESTCLVSGSIRFCVALGCTFKELCLPYDWNEFYMG